jgi:molecular chaperone DnaJ
MTPAEAFSILDLPKTATDSELKSKYKELAVKYHPDVYALDPNKFKVINEAYQTIQDYKQNPAKYEPRQSFPGNGFQYGHINLDDIFSQFGNMRNASQTRISDPPPKLNIQISFKESILGQDKEVKYKRLIKCETCNGAGLEHISNGCKSCNGFGRMISRSGGFVSEKTCNKCYGRNIKKNQCIKCEGKGTLETEISGFIQVPAGVSNDANLRLQGAGHYQGNSMFGDAYGDVYVNVAVEKDDELELAGQDVISHIKLPLVDAISGCSRKVKTIHDVKNLDIPPLSKNKDELRIENHGVKNTNGVQRVILDVIYPTDTKELVEFLKNKQN